MAKNGWHFRNDPDDPSHFLAEDFVDDWLLRSFRLPQPLNLLKVADQLAVVVKRSERLKPLNKD